MYRRRFVIFFSIYLSFFVIMSTYAKNTEDLRTEISRKEHDVNSINRHLKEKKEEIAILGKRKLSVLDEIYNLEVALEKGKNRLSQIEKKQEQIDKHIEGLEMELKILKKRRSDIGSSMKERLIAIYKNRHGGVLRIIFSTKGLNDLGRNLKIVTGLLNHDILLLNTYKKNQTRLEESKERLDDYRIELDRSRREYTAEMEKLLRQKKKRQSLIERIEREEYLQLVTLKELEIRASELQSLIKQLRNDIKRQNLEKRDIGFASMRGKLGLPVDGEIISLFGKIKHPRFKTITFNKGIEIKTETGANVRSVFKGEVIYTGWFKGYGKMMIINHGEGYYTLFAHLSENLKDVGKNVERGEVVALAGDTGSLKGPILYFEVRFHGVPKDPLEWIDSTKIGGHYVQSIQEKK